MKILDKVLFTLKFHMFSVLFITVYRSEAGILSNRLHVELLCFLNLQYDGKLEQIYFQMKMGHTVSTSSNFYVAPENWSRYINLRKLVLSYLWDIKQMDDSLQELTFRTILDFKIYRYYTWNNQIFTFL